MVRSEVVAFHNESKPLDFPTLTTASLRLKGYFQPVSHLHRVKPSTPASWHNMRRNKPAPIRHGDSYFLDSGRLTAPISSIYWRILPNSKMANVKISKSEHHQNHQIIRKTKAST
jgi:hypothetical protein